MNAKNSDQYDANHQYHQILLFPSDSIANMQTNIDDNDLGGTKCLWLSGGGGVQTIEEKYIGTSALPNPWLSFFLTNFHNLADPTYLQWWGQIRLLWNI